MTTPANTTCVSFVPTQDDEPEFGRWIKVKDRLPKEGVSVFAWMPGCPEEFTGYLRNGVWSCCVAPWARVEGITHWMPRPDLPKETT